MKITIRRGDTVTLTIPLRDGATAYTPPAGATAIFSVKRRLTDPDSAAVVQKITGGGISFSTTNALVSLLTADTNLIADRHFRYDVQVQETGGRVLTAAIGEFEISADVTQLLNPSIPINTTDPITAFNSLSTRISTEESVRAVADASIEENMVEQLSGKQGVRIVSANVTASLFDLHVNVASATYDDPTPPIEGGFFEVFVRNGTATVGGTPYATAGTLLVRSWHSGAWATHVITGAGGAGVSVITGATTAAASTTYHARGTFPVEDFATPATDAWYEVRVFGAGSVVTVGGAGAIVLGPGDRVIRRWDGSAWVNNPVFAEIPVAVVTVTETVTNSATLTPSTQLTHDLLPGVYWVEMEASINASSLVTSGANVALDFTGSATSGPLVAYELGRNATTLNSATPQVFFPASFNFSRGSATQSRGIKAAFNLAVTATGALRVLFAQHTASAGQSAFLIAGYQRIIRTA